MEKLKAVTDDELGHAIAAVETEYPNLTHAGWGDGSALRNSVAFNQAFQQHVRQSLWFIRESVTAQEAANNEADSYRLMRIARNWCCGQKIPDRISHGGFILAAIIAGYFPTRYPGSGPACAFNMHLLAGPWLFDANARLMASEVARTIAIAVEERWEEI
jgi:hypothetical protein